jgi:hypothetical protein
MVTEMTRICTKTIPFSLDVLQEIDVNNSPKIRGKTLESPRGIMSSELNEKSNQQQDEKKATSNAAYLRNYLSQVV